MGGQVLRPEGQTRPEDLPVSKVGEREEHLRPDLATDSQAEGTAGAWEARPAPEDRGRMTKTLQDR